MKDHNNIFAFDTFIVRIPLLPVSSIDQFKGIQNEQELIPLVKKLFEDPLVKEAIYIASRDFHDTLQKWCANPGAMDAKSSKKILFSFLKYYNRMCTRCTPFGLFSGCGVGSIAEHSSVIIEDYRKFNRYTRLDTYVICSIIQHIALETEFKRLLKYYPNTSIYFANNQYRYVEYFYSHGKKIHELVSVEQSDFVDLILEKAKGNGITYDEIIAIFEPYDVDPHQVKEFVDDIIKTQLLISELEPSISGDNLIAVLLKNLGNIVDRSDKSRLSGQTLAIITVLSDIEQSLRQLDEHTLVNKIGLYEKIQAAIEQLGVKVNTSILFQVDMGISFSECTLGHSVVTQVTTALDIFSRFSPTNSPSPRTPGHNLSTFIAAFVSRYEDAEVPLLEVLDTESGIGYIQDYKEEAIPSPLLEDIIIPAGKASGYNDIVWDVKVHGFFFEKYVDAVSKKLEVISLTDEEINAFPSHLDQMADTFSAFVSIISDEREPGRNISESPGNKLVIYPSGGSSACNLIGRFCFLDEQINEMALKITGYEKERNPDMIVAEICHLPDTRLGNILMRPNIREYEIPYLSNSILPEDKQIQVGDLMISVNNGTVYLRSKKLNKYVLPRLSSAHHFSYNSLPAYHFLGDLQMQNMLRSLYLNFGILSRRASYFPRIIYKNLVLTRAWWRFKRKDLVFLDKSGSQEVLTGFNLFKSKHNLPDSFILVEDDQELYIDVHTLPFLEMFFEIAKKRDTVTLVENIFKDARLAATSKNGDYLHEFLIQYGSSVQKNTTLPVIAKNTDGITRSFMPGGACLYFKIYSGLKSADKIMCHAVKTFLDDITAEGLIKKWFFIRYGDPDAHIRLRIFPGDGMADPLVKRLHDVLQPLVNDRIVWKIQLDTYNREIERYNYEQIKESENIFFADSRYVINVISFLTEHSTESFRWYFSLCNVDHYLKMFELTIEEKCTITGRFRDAFLLEFNADPQLKSQLDAKFKNNKDLIAFFLSDKINEAFSEKPLERNIKQKIEELLLEKESILGNTAALIKGNASGREIENLLSSYLHMHINRIFPSKQRLHELIIYYVLHRYYTYIKHTAKA